jgi:hypothetical protein
MKDFGYAGMQSHIQQICINMIVMECGWGRSANGGWENYCAVRESQLCSWSSNIQLQFCQLHENSGCLFVLGFGTMKIFSKYGSSQYVLALTHQCFHSDTTGMCLVCSQIGCRDTEHTTTLSMRERVERNIRVGPLGLLDASPFRTMVWN